MYALCGCLPWVSQWSVAVVSFQLSTGSVFCLLVTRPCGLPWMMESLFSVTAAFPTPLESAVRCAGSRAGELVAFTEYARKRFNPCQEVIACSLFFTRSQAARRFDKDSRSDDTDIRMPYSRRPAKPILKLFNIVHASFSCRLPARDFGARVEQARSRGNSAASKTCRRWTSAATC